MVNISRFMNLANYFNVQQYGETGNILRLQRCEQRGARLVFHHSRQLAQTAVPYHSRLASLPACRFPSGRNTVFTEIAVLGREREKVDPHAVVFRFRRGIYLIQLDPAYADWIIMLLFTGYNAALTAGAVFIFYKQS